MLHLNEFSKDVILLIERAPSWTTHTHTQPSLLLWLYESCRSDGNLMRPKSLAHPALLIHNTSCGFNLTLASWWLTNVPCDVYLKAMSVTCLCYVVVWLLYCAGWAQAGDEALSLLATCLKCTTQQHHLTCAIKLVYLWLSNICPAPLKKGLLLTDFGLSLSCKCLLE